MTKGVTRGLATARPAATVLQRVGNVEEEIRRRVAPMVNESVSSERALAARVIDVLPLIQRAWPEDDG